MDTQEIRNAIRNSNLQYLWDAEGEEYTTKQECDASTNGADCKGDFISCLMGSAKLPACTKGLCFVSEKRSYSEYVRSWDGDYPTPGAKIICTGAYYTFCTIITLPSGNRVLAHAFKSTQHEPRVIGIV